MDNTTVFLLIQVVELVVFVLILRRVQTSMLGKLKQNFEAVLQFIGEKSFFDTLSNALDKAQKQLNTSFNEEDKLEREIEEAQRKLAELRNASETIRSTIITIEGLQL